MMSHRRLLLLLPLLLGFEKKSDPATIFVTASSPPSSSVSPSIATPPLIVHIMADDLGRDNLGRLNGNKTSTPHIDALLFDRGLFLSDFYTFKICGPSRASTLTGRYPFNVGFYGDGDAQHISNYTTTAELLKELGYQTHAIGKWDVGYVVKETTPTHKGFDTFFGYYKACNQDLFYHSTSSCTGNIGTDFSRNDLTNGTLGPARGYNGTYSTRIFTDLAVQRIQEYAEAFFVNTTLTSSATNGAEPPAPFYLYVAPQNVHLACGSKASKAIRGIQAPCETVEGGWFDRVANDTYKAQSAVTKELDYLVGNITEALESSGLWNQTLVVFTSDNGGPLDHTTNYPLRGGKHTFWEGGVRVLAGLGGGYVPKSRRGRVFSGIVHSADWQRTLVEGVAGGVPRDRNGTGPTPDDSFNLWPALAGDVDASPRTEVIHQVLSTYSPDSVGAIRVGDMKLIWGGKVGDARILKWPELADSNIAFGATGGSRRNDDHPSACLAGAVTDGAAQMNFMNCSRGCLFNLTADRSERENLRDAYPDIVSALKHKLDLAAASAPPASSYWTDPTRPLQNICKAQDASGFLEPLGVRG